MNPNIRIIGSHPLLSLTLIVNLLQQLKEGIIYGEHSRKKNAEKIHPNATSQVQIEVLEEVQEQ